MAAALGFSMVLADWMILEISCLGAIGAAAGACLVGTCGPGMAASIRIGCLSFLEDLSWNEPLLG